VDDGEEIYLYENRSCTQAYRKDTYSVPAHLVGEMVFVHIGLDERLKVYDEQARLVAEHLLRPASAGWQVDEAHHRRLWAQAMPVQTRGLDAYEEAGHGTE